jgi:integrase/recombinase XerD
MHANYFHFTFEDYIYHLHQHGYTPNTIRGYCQAVEHFGCWLENKKIPKNGINKIHLSDFIKYHLSACTCSLPRTKDVKIIRAAVNQLLKIIPPTSQKLPLYSTENHINEIIHGYNEYLLNACGVAKNTIIYRNRYAIAFLKYMQINSLQDIEKINPRQIISFFKKFTATYATGSIGVVSTSLRSFFKYAALSGFNVKNLLRSVPNIPNWKLSQVPSFLSKVEINKLLNIFNRKEPSGKRDYAITRCFTDLGLRCCEVSGIKIKDIDWHAGIINLYRSKSCQTNQLPLTISIGEAISDYLLNGRPKSNSEYVFVRNRAPLGKAFTTNGIRSIMHRSFQKAGFNPIPSIHILRRSLATELLNVGASLKEIADVLGHKCIDTTMIYAKVDIPHLSLVAMPWLGVSHE